MPVVTKAAPGFCQVLYHADDGGSGIQKDKIVVVDLRGSIAGYALLLVDVQLGFCDKIRLVGPGLHRLPQGDGLRRVP